MLVISLFLPYLTLPNLTYLLTYLSYLLYFALLYLIQLLSYFLNTCLLILSGHVGSGTRPRFPPLSVFWVEGIFFGACELQGFNGFYPWVQIIRCNQAFSTFLRVDGAPLGPEEWSLLLW